MELRHAGLRATRQRVQLSSILFAKGNRHLSAEDLHAEAEAAGVHVSLATVYNALHKFTRAGMLRAVAIDSGRAYFDTNVSDHHHFFIEDEGELIDLNRGYWHQTPTRTSRGDGDNSRRIGSPHTPSALKTRHLDPIKVPNKKDSHLPSRSRR